MLVIPSLPQTPSPNNKNLHEHGPAPQPFPFMNGFKPVPKQGPTHGQSAPALLTKRACEEEMLHCFFRWIMTEETAIIVILQNKVPPSKQIAGVQSICQQQPGKYLPLVGAT